MASQLQVATIMVAYNESNGTWTFLQNGTTPISEGDLTASHGLSTFQFQPAPGETWTFETFYVSLEASHSSPVRIMGGVLDAFAITLTPKLVVVADFDNENVTNTFKYGFTVKLADGSIATCDPKIFNKGN